MKAQRDPFSKTPIRNAVVIMFDSLQYNYLGCNGNTWIETPNFDRFAAEGVNFDNCYIEGVPTIPCRRAMLTGRYSLPFAGWSALRMDETTIADMCWGRPIDTAIIFDSAPMRIPKFGYTRGFDKVWFLHGHEIDHTYYAEDPLLHYTAMDFHEESAINGLRALEQKTGFKLVDQVMEETECYLKNRQHWKGEEDQNVARIMKKSVQYLENVDRNKSFFLWVDSFDPHEPWDPPSVYDKHMKCPYNPDYTGKDQFLPAIGAVQGIYTEPELHHIRMLYAEKVTMCDRWLGYFMDNLKRLGLDQNTLVMIVSDHGEPMGNGEHGHGIMRKCRPWPYEELVHGVMMLRGPGIPTATRIKAYTQSCDVAPTICDWLGIGVQSFHQGKSLLKLAKGEVNKVRDFAIAGYHKYSWSIITDDWSFIHWLKSEEEVNSAKAAYKIYFEGSQEHAGHLGDGTNVFGTGIEREGQSGESINARIAKMQSEASLDGEDQWTCTPSSTVEVPASDELYDRRQDPYQLNNVLDKNPEAARTLFDQLRLFIGELRTS